MYEGKLPTHSLIESHDTGNHFCECLQKNISSFNAAGPTSEITSTWNKGIASLRELTSQKKE